MTKRQMLDFPAKTTSHLALLIPHQKAPKGHSLTTSLHLFMRMQFLATLTLKGQAHHQFRLRRFE
tara:strand:+ start:345 stop:539 length:195 start_codon:yes stop_codon:yes gene_type:complete